MMFEADETFTRQLDFLIEADRLKQVLRKTSLLDGSRKENSAEHSWQLILTAMTFADYANEPIDLFKVMQMFALHDLGEITAGDTLHYHKTTKSEEDEKTAVEQLFSRLPPAQAKRFMDLWIEFSEAKTAEAKFAQAIDRLWPHIQNTANAGGTWREFNVTFEQVFDRNIHVDSGSTMIWQYIVKLLENAREAGILAP